ncbi:hypothetical protein [Bacillus sp. Marseille-P3800]|uniref:hypothetical protein n=1 Tax=Bacillus sp. Marseille-P3800 TaxID=2014782 RepID=UPI00159BBD8F|nr:hypothetical protein [Bacillus sp. Marseille-P3800]
MKTKTAYAGVLSFSILGILQWLDGPFTFVYISFGIAAVFLPFDIVQKRTPNA